MLRKVEGLAARGATIEQIAHCLDWAVSTLYSDKKRWGEIKEAIKKGQDKGIAAVENALFESATKGKNITAQIFYLKNRDPEKWKDRTEVKTEEHKKIEIHFDMSIYTKDELRKIINGELIPTPKKSLE